MRGEDPDAHPIGGIMARFPMFVDLHGKKAVVIGGGKIGLRRAKVLLDFGAAVTVIAPALSQPLPEAKYLARCYQPGDLAGAFLAVAATNDRAVNKAVVREANTLGIPVNTADCPEECDFFFPAVCVGNHLVAGVTGDGTDHHKTAEAARRIRDVLEDLG